MKKKDETNSKLKSLTKKAGNITKSLIKGFKEGYNETYKKGKKGPRLNKG